MASLATGALVIVLLILWLLSFQRARDLSKAREELAVDELTGVLRRVAGMAAIDREIQRSRRHNTPLSVAFVDVDALKQVNDHQGHAAGDALLTGVATVLQERLRGNDLVFRFGGDEFVCVLPEADHIACERVFRSLRTDAIEKGFGFSFGVASLRESDDASSLLARADTNLYDKRSEERGVGPAREEEQRPRLLPETELPA